MCAGSGRIDETSARCHCRGGEAGGRSAWELRSFATIGRAQATAGGVAQKALRFRAQARQGGDVYPVIEGMRSNGGKNKGPATAGERAADEYPISARWPDADAS